MPRIESRAKTFSGQGLVALNNKRIYKRVIYKPYMVHTWRVLEEDDVLSDHLSILVKLEVQGGGGLGRDFIMAADPARFLKNLKQVAIERWNGEDVDITIGKITRAYIRSKTLVKTDSSGTMPYWWDDEIAGLVRCTRSCRRKY